MTPRPFPRFCLPRPPRPSRNRAATLALAALATVAAALAAPPTREDLLRRFLERPEGTVPLGRATRGVREFTLEVHRVTAEIAPGVKVEQWAFARPGEAPAVPGPELRVRVGERVRITLVNTHDQPHALHLHGITSLAQEMDGVPHLSREVRPGGTFTYEFVATEAGTHAYHCHFQTNVHLDMGMYGALIVEDPDAPRPWTAEHTLALDEWDSRGVPVSGLYEPRYDTFLVNGKAHPLIPDLKIPAGETHLVRFVHLGARPHSLHLHGTSFLVVAKDGHDLPLPYLADTLPILPGERYDVLVKGRDGTFPWHDHDTRANTNRGEYPGGMHFDVTGGPALAADGRPAAHAGHAHAHGAAPVGAPAHDAEAGPGPEAAVVAIKNFEFRPETPRVRAGGTVTWRNDDPVPHRVVVDLGGREEAFELAPGASAAVRFPAAGRFAFRCAPHPFMTGTVEVGPA